MGGTFPAGDQPGALVDSVRDVSLDPGAVAARGERTHLRLRVEGAADDHGGELVRECLDEFVVALPGDHDPGQRGADLAGQDALGRGEGLRGGGEVGVVQHDGGGLAPEFQRAAGDPVAAQARDPAPRGGGPGEGDLVDARVGDEQFGDVPIGSDHVQDTGRKPDLARDLGADVTLAGSLGRALEHDGAPGQQGRSHLVGDHRDRRVPGDDRADDADRFADQEPEGARRGLHDVLERIGGGQIGVEVPGVRRLRDRPLRMRGEDARLPRPDLGDLVRPLAQPDAERAQELRPFGG